MADLTQGVTALLFFSVIIQYITEQIKNILPLEKIPNSIIKPQLWSLVVSLIVTFSFKVDMFATLGFKIDAHVWIAYILTAILISGGAVVFNEIIKSLQAVKDGKFIANDINNPNTPTGGVE